MKYQLMNSFISIPSVTINIGMENNEKSNEKYLLVLKNLIKEVKRELSVNYKHVDCTQLEKYLDEIENDFQPSRNEESVILFISNEIKKTIIVPFLVENEIHIGERFTTRKLLRHSNKNTHYYVLTLSDKEARLMEYQNERLIREIKDEKFPLVNKGYWTNDSLLNSMGSVRTNYQKEFFKFIDSELQLYLNRDPHPIILASVIKNTSLYKTIASRNDLIIGEISGNFTTINGENELIIGQKSYEIIEEYNKNQVENLRNTLDEYNGKGRLEQDLNTIYQAALIGRAKKLILDEEYYQEGIIQDNSIKIDFLNRSSEDYMEDVVNEIIYQVMRYGGEVIFVKKDQLGNYPRVVLQTRY
ncbi:hypothetical protein [Carnobacterium maltaromaticum]|uniref:baeRF3 domain-containing protein n=1 Tax=Carnobacterium maltaromaticum TaxID=2751 RepID=UPI00295E8443|nr:hypothetical protein [Carnobacterium maltaromaticum]